MVFFKKIPGLVKKHGMIGQFSKADTLAKRSQTRLEDKEHSLFSGFSVILERE